MGHDRLRKQARLTGVMPHSSQSALMLKQLEACEEKSSLLLENGGVTKQIESEN